MRTKIIYAAIGILLLSPFAASAQSVYLSFEARQQLLVFAQQLVQILNELSIARSYGAAYQSSAEFAQKGLQWVNQISLIQQSVSVLLTSAPTPTNSYQSGTCPSLYRDLVPGIVGSDVGELQRFLANDTAARYLGQVHNLYDPATVAAMQRFQAAYGIVNAGSPQTTGFGRTGPATRAMIATRCTSFPTTPTVGYSSGTMTVATNGHPTNTASFTIRTIPNSTCAPSHFTLSFGDGSEQPVSFSASCTSQSQTIIHTYPQGGTYVARLSSGSFQSTVSVNLNSSDSWLSMIAKTGDIANEADVELVFNAGSSCRGQTYTVRWDDGSENTISFSDSCGAQTRQYSHSYSGGGTYTIRAVGPDGRSSSLNFQATVQSNPQSNLIFRGDGTHGAKTFANSGTGSYITTAYGNAMISTTQSKFGGASLSFDGASSYITIPDSNDWNMDGNFTVDFWLYVNAGAPTANFFGQQPDSGSFSSPFLIQYEQATSRINSFISKDCVSWDGVLSSGTIAANSWTHVALVRSGSSVTQYINGVAAGSKTVSGSLCDSPNPLRLGGIPSYYLNGYLDDVRITKGAALWTGTFTPPSTTAGATPALTLKINGQEGTAYAAHNSSFTLEWSSSNVSSCSSSTFGYDDNPQPWTTGVNTAQTYTGSLTTNSLFYKLSCTGTNGEQVSKTVRLIRQ